MYKNNDSYVGILAVYVGPPFDPPRGWVKSFKFDPVSKKVSFESTLKTGLRFSKDKNNWVPAIDKYLFDGRFNGNDLVGNFQIMKISGSGIDLPAERVELKDKSTKGYDSNILSFKEWQSMYSPLVYEPED